QDQGCPRRPAAGQTDWRKRHPQASPSSAGASLSVLLSGSSISVRQGPCTRKPAPSASGDVDRVTPPTPGLAPQALHGGEGTAIRRPKSRLAQSPEPPPPRRGPFPIGVFGYGS